MLPKRLPTGKSGSQTISTITPLADVLAERTLNGQRRKLSRDAMPRFLISRRHFEAAQRPIEALMEMLEEGWPSARFVV